MLPLADTESHRAAALKEILNQVASRSYIHLSWSLRDKSSKSAREGFFFFFLTKADNIFSTDQPIAWSLYISPLWVWACVWVWPVCDPHCLNSCISLAPWCIRWSTLLLLPPKTLGPLSPSQFNKHHLFCLPSARNTAGNWEIPDNNVCFLLFRMFPPRGWTARFNMVC